MDRFLTSGLVSSILRFTLYSSYGTEDDVQVEWSRRDMLWVYLLVFQYMPANVIYMVNDIYPQLRVLCLDP